ncbi:MAG: GDCCVxC domain-containing (seleno)protein [Bacillota bacterium]
MAALILESTLTCPACRYRETETMPVDSCQYLYECGACHALHKPKKGDCCVYCSYGSVPCPPKQLEADGRPECCR